MESKHQKIFKNTLFLSSSQIISRAIGFVYFIFLARNLGVEQFGVYVFIISLVYNFVPVADFGLERLLLRDVSRSANDEYLVKMIPLRLFLSLLAFLLCILLGFVLKLSGSQIILLTAFALSLIFVNLTNLVTSFLNAKEQMHYMAGANIVTIVLTAFLGVASRMLGFNLFWLYFSYTISCFFVSLYFYFLIKKIDLKIFFKVDLIFIKRVLSESWIFAVFTILAVFYLRATLLMTKTFLGAESAGLYGSVYKFIEAGILLPQALTLALFPLSSKLTVESPKKLAGLYLKGIGVLFLMALPFIGLMAIFPRQIVLLAYGEAYLAAVQIVPVLGVSLVLFFVNALPGNIIQNSDKVKKFLPYSILIFLFIYLAGFLLIPKFGLIGAAWAVVAGELFGFIVSNVFVYKLLKN